jgi:hypothetical protein
MKKTLEVFLSAKSLGIAVALAVLFVSALGAQAVIVFDNTGGFSETSTANYPPPVTYGQSFIMTSGSGAIDGLTLLFGSGSSGSAEVDLYNFNGNVWSPVSTLGTVDGSGVVNLTSNPILQGNSVYAIVLQVPSSGSLSWLGTTALPTTGFSPGASMYSVNGGVNWNNYLSQSFQMQVSAMTAVPEVPITGVVMGLAVFAIGVGRATRRKHHPMV